MSCSNCYNGCSQITSDQCVRYTGIDVPVLGIQNGDSLSYVEQALIEFLVSTLDGSGIKVDIPQDILCDLVSSKLPKCGDITVVDVLNTLIQAACDLQSQITDINGQINGIQAAIDEINGPYTLPSSCLSGVTSASTTHEIVQSIITNLCAFITDVETNYVLISDINTYIEQYIASQSLNTKQYTKMIPYVAYEYYGSLTNFNGNGQGQGDWEKIYLCNGDNGTPDKRGRVAVGVTTGMGGGPMSPYVNPGGLNPDYTLNSTFGSNGITLSIQQLPSHTHVPNVVFNDPGHTHTYKSTGTVTSGGDPAIEDGPIINSNATGAINSSTTGITISISNDNTGENQSHPNNQPAIGCYYIMYIP